MKQKHKGMPFDMPMGGKKVMPMKKPARRSGGRGK